MNRKRRPIETYKSPLFWYSMSVKPLLLQVALSVKSEATACGGVYGLPPARFRARCIHQLRTQ